MSRKRSQQGHASDNESNSNSARAKKRSKPNGTSHLAHNNADSEASDSEPFSQLIGLEGLDLELFKKVRYLSMPARVYPPILHGRQLF